MATAGNLQQQLIELLDKGADRLILELSQLTFICSVGLGAIIAAHLHCRHHLSEVRLVNPQEAIKDLLKVTRLTRLFAIHDTVEGAIAAK